MQELSAQLSGAPSPGQDFEGVNVPGRSGTRGTALGLSSRAAASNRDHPGRLSPPRSRIGNNIGAALRGTSLPGQPRAVGTPWGGPFPAWRLPASRRPSEENCPGEGPGTAAPAPPPPRNGRLPKRAPRRQAALRGRLAVGGGAPRWSGGRPATGRQRPR